MHPAFTALPIVAAVAIVTPALATPRTYLDFSVTSPDGRYRLDARSPENTPATSKSRRVAFQRDFVCTLTDTTTGKQIWTRTQPREEASPVDAWVHASGLTVVRTASDQLQIFKASGGEPTATIDILRLFTPEDSKHVAETTAGPRWSQSSLWYFIEHEGATLFVTRAWWDTRIIVNTATGATVRDEGKARDTALAAEKRHILSVLESSAKLGGPHTDPTTGEHDVEALHDTMTATHLAGRNAIKEAVPFLLKLEQWDYSGRSTGGGYAYDVADPRGMVFPFTWSELSVRCRAQVALRRLGATPAGLPATRFERYAPYPEKGPPIEVALKGTRAECVPAVKAGMSPLEVLKVIDAPDDVVFTHSAWEYDVDANPPFTLRVVWTTSGTPTVKSVERITPPVWKGTGARDHVD